MITVPPHPSGDDTTSLQTALDAAAPGDTVQLTPGYLYRTSAPLHLRPNVTLAGSHAPRWQYRGGTPAGIAPLSSFAGEAVLRVGEGVDGGRIERVAVDGKNYGDGVAGLRIEGLARDWTVTDSDFSHTSGNGVECAADPTGVPRGIHLHNVSSYSAGADGFCFDHLTDSTLSGLLAVDAAADGIRLSGGGDTRLVDCRAVFCGINGFRLTGSPTVGGVQMVGCSTDRNGSDGVSIWATGDQPIVISNLLTRRDGADPALGQRAGLRVHGPSDVGSAPVMVTGWACTTGVEDDGTGHLSPAWGLRYYHADLTIVGALPRGVDADVQRDAGPPAMLI